MDGALASSVNAIVGAFTGVASSARNAVPFLFRRRSLQYGASHIAVLSVLAYLVLCARLRCQRVRSRQRKMNFTSRESMSKMTNTEAQSIIQTMTQFEFPTMFKMSLQFALFKVGEKPVELTTFSFLTSKLYIRHMESQQSPTCSWQHACLAPLIMPVSDTKTRRC